MTKLRLLPLLMLALVCLCTSAFAANIPGQQRIDYIEDDNGQVTSLTDDDAASAWTQSSSYGADLSIHLNSAAVGEIWVRNGYAYTQNWYNHYDRVKTLLVTIYYQANRYTESYDSYRYTLTDAFRPSSYTQGWNGGYQRLLLPKKYTGVTKIELTVESSYTGSNRTGATIADIILASGSHATATPKSYATATPRPYVVYVTATPGPAAEDNSYVEIITPRPSYDDDGDSYVEYITPVPTDDNDADLVIRITPEPTVPPLVQLITPVPQPADYPSSVGEIGYSNQRIPTRSGPGTMYDEPGSFFSEGHEVKVTSKSWDARNRRYWYQIEFEYKDAWYRVYTTESRIDVDASNVPEEPPRGEPLDTKKSLFECDIYYGPGAPYARVHNVTMGEGKRCEVYVIENDWALVDYYDYALDTDRRGWIPVACLYGEGE